MTQEQKTQWLATLTNAISYLHVASDYTPHNGPLIRHIGNLTRLSTELNACVADS